MKNEYIPYPVKIEKISRETFDTKTYTVKFVDEKLCVGKKEFELFNNIDAIEEAVKIL